MNDAPAARRSRPFGFAPPKILYGIEAMRGVGMLVVMLFHAVGAEIGNLLPGPYVVVDFFYAVSGFVLCHAYGARLEHDLGGLGFMRLRLIRVFPLYLLALFIAVAANLGIILASGSLPEPALFLISIVASSLLLPLVPALAWRHHHPYPFNGTSWTLFWELLVNLIWSLLGPKLTDRLLGWLVAVGVVMLIVALSLPTKLEHGGSFTNFHVGGLRVVYGFFSGVAAYRLWVRGYFTWLRLPIWASVLALTALVCLRPHGGNFVYDLVGTLLMPVLVFVSTAPAPARLVPLFETTGRIAYAAYILNFPLLLLMDQLLARAGPPILMTAPIRVPAFVVLTLVAAFAADRWFDQPARKWLSRRFAPPNHGHVPGDRPAAS